uniref:Uncharacterized protein n=1 Tax=Ciona savignyi TaxID=51511 RepID=H2Z7N6_CIOSA
MNCRFSALIGVILCSAVQCMDVPCRNGDGQLVSLEMCSGVGYCVNNGTHCNAQAQQTSLLIGNDLTKFTASLEEDNDTLDARLFPIGGVPFGGQSITPPVPYGNGQLPTNIPSSLPGGLPPLPEISGLFPGTGGSPPGLGNVGGLPPGLGLPGSLIPGSVGTVFPNTCQNSFPSICGISTYSTNILQLLDAPVNIPYCRRIPCSTSNPMLETDRFACHAVPGCYFDLELANLRRMYPNSVLPGVPVCHLAIRNRKFQYLANQYMQGRGTWNGIYNKCFIEQNKNEIYSPDAGCYVIIVLKYMGIQRKLAGWDGITTEECYLIDGCPVDGGCFHPGQLNQIQVRSGEDETRNSFNSGMNYYGQPKCMEYNPTTSDELLQGYHQCRQAGCVVDPQINSDVLKYNLYRVARTLPANKQAKFWGEVIQNRITPDNYQQFLNKIEQRCVLPGNGIKGYNNLLAYSLTLGVLGSGASVPRSVLPNNPMFQPQCPYQNFGAGLTSLRGKFTGCCERNLCYIP